MNRISLLSIILLVAVCASAGNVWDDVDSLKLTVPHAKPRKVTDDLTLAGLPVFVAGWATNGEKLLFAASGKEQPHKSTLFDDYSQFLSPALAVSLKAAGYEGRSNWPRFVATAAMSYGIMCGVAEGLKRSDKKMRPDGSTADSWPSGHTATSFVGATILHREYGLTRSPWFSVAGYGMAATTGAMRVFHNRHWASDVLAGAGIGILSAEAAYALSDVFFRDKGLLRNNLEDAPESPSFISISMGLGIGGETIAFSDEDDMAVRFRPAIVADAEGAWFFSDYVGVGGRLRVRTMSPRSLGRFADMGGEWTANTDELIRSSHLAEFTPSAGIYLNVPLAARVSLGAKGLVGYAVMQNLDVDMLTLDATNAASLATGISLSYRHQSRFAWTLFFDYDVSHKDFTLQVGNATFEKTKSMHCLTAGASFTTNF